MQLIPRSHSFRHPALVALALVLAFVGDPHPSPPPRPVRRRSIPRRAAAPPRQRRLRLHHGGGLNTFYRYFIEVPPGLARLVVEIFDADVGLGGSGEDEPGATGSAAAVGTRRPATASAIRPEPCRNDPVHHRQRRRPRQLGQRLVDPPRLDGRQRPRQLRDRRLHQQRRRGELGRATGPRPTTTTMPGRDRFRSPAAASCGSATTAAPPRRSTVRPTSREPDSRRRRSASTFVPRASMPVT